MTRKILNIPQRPTDRCNFLGCVGDEGSATGMGGTTLISQIGEPLLEHIYDDLWCDPITSLCVDDAVVRFPAIGGSLSDGE